MSDTKEKHATFTPGPWHAWCCKENETGGGIFQDTNTDSQKMICRMAKDKRVTHKDKRKSDDFVHSAEDEANARLIAAAPEMYEVLKEIFRLSEIGLSSGILYGKKLVTEMGTENIPTHEKVRAILDKVEGETA